MSQVSSLANPNYRHYFISSCFGTLAVWMTRFLLGWLIWETTESFFWVGVASTSVLLPSLIITPIFGVISDRINLKKGVITMLLTQAVVTFATLLVFRFVGQSLPWILAMTFLFGCVAAAGSPLRLTLIPKLVTQAELPNAVGWGAMLFNSSRIVAPAIAAWCLTFMSVEMIFILCTVFFAMAGLINMSLPNVQGVVQKSNQSGWQDFKKGFAYCFSVPMIRLMFILTLTNSQIARSFMELLPALSGTLTSGRASDLAFLTGCAGFGSIIGGWFISRQKGAVTSMLNVLMGSMAITALLLLPMLFTLTLWPIGFLVGGISLFMTILGTGSQILLQMESDDNKRGRVMSLWLTIALVGPAIGALLMGLIAELFGFPVMLVLMVALSLLSAVWTKVAPETRHIKHGLSQP
jgi:MFS family permease